MDHGRSEIIMGDDGVLRRWECWCGHTLEDHVSRRGYRDDAPRGYACAKCELSKGDSGCDEWQTEFCDWVRVSEALALQ